MRELKATDQLVIIGAFKDVDMLHRKAANMSARGWHILAKQYRAMSRDLTSAIQLQRKSVLEPESMLQFPDDEPGSSVTSN